MRPSTVLLGLIRGASLRLPNAMPVYKANVSFAVTATSGMPAMADKIQNAGPIAFGGVHMESGHVQNGGSETGYAPVYFPGTTAGRGAAMVALDLSQERAGLDMQLPLVAMGRITGVGGKKLEAYGTRFLEEISRH